MNFEQLLWLPDEKYIENMKSPSIYVQELCQQTYPCGHYVIIKNKDGSVEKKSLSGYQIYDWYISNNLPVDNHFEDYRPENRL